MSGLFQRRPSILIIVMKNKFLLQKNPSAKPGAIRKYLCFAVALLLADRSAFANPTGMTVGAGSASLQQVGSQLNITTSQAAFLNWSSFNIRPGETTTFLQPSANSIVFNQIGGANPSKIFGSLNANGTVILANANGFYFGPNSMISVGGSFIATTAPLSPDFGAGSAWQFTGMPPLASIVNYGQIQVGTGKSLYLIAEQIENHGELTAPGGDVGLYAGQSVLVSERPDGRGLSATMKLPGGSVNNYGQIIASAGTIALQAEVVNQNGILQADSVQNQNGVIELVASDSLNLGANSQILARGDDSAAGSPGGVVTLQSGNTFSDSVGSQISVTGGTKGGNGGSVEVSAPNIFSLNSSMDASASAGSPSGQLLLNSQDITLNTSGANGMNGGTLDLNVNSAFANFSQIILQADDNITLAAGNIWNLGSGSGQLTLEASGDITFENNSKIFEADNWSVTLDAGYNFVTDMVQAGTGNIYLNGGSGQAGNGSIETSQATIKLLAGNGIFVGYGSQLINDGGIVGLYAQMVNQNGLIQANSVGGQHGTIELIASDSVMLGANSKIIANGDNSPSGSSGGQIMLQTQQAFFDVAGSQIQFLGANGGANGRVLIYAAQSSVKSLLNGSAASSASGNIYYYTPVDNLTLTASSLVPFTGFSSILFQANKSLTISASANLDLSTGTGIPLDGLLTLQSGGDITFGNNSQIFAANNWSVTLNAGYANNMIQSGIGNIYLNGGSAGTLNGSIQTASGDINLSAGQSILLASKNNHTATGIVSGSVFTTGGGNIFAYAMMGNIDAGTSNGAKDKSGKPADYNFDDSGATPNTSGLGGISTMGGGNVSLIAGNNIDSTPVVPSGQWPGASGAYGSGDVTIIAGNQINGNFTLANGVGTMLAGAQVNNGQAAVLQNSHADHASTLYDLETAVTQNQSSKGDIGGFEFVGGSKLAVTLSLIQGSWNVWAADNILLKEVNNPNGTFNSAQSYLYNYAADAAAHFWAGNAIELAGGTVGGTLARKANPFIIYAPILTLNAGMGGITIDKSIILAPSSEGSLEITTRNGGDLSSTPPVASSGSTPTLNGITMSDSDSTDYHTFASRHATHPLHANDPNPVTLDISGSIGSFSLVVPTFADIIVHGIKPYVVSGSQPDFGTYNFGFNGRNLSADQTTFINVFGDIVYQALSIANQNVTLGNQGLTVAGPGTFNVSAQNIDLGVSGGIAVLAPDSALKAISPRGANLEVTASGNLAMTSSKISNESYLGGINLDVGGVLNVGGQSTKLGADTVAKGIFTTSGGDVSVTAASDVNVNSSRIAAYDGGSVTVTSQNGDINAGVGGSGYVSFDALELKKNKLINIPAQIPGSGILATTVLGSRADLGDITLEAPNGNINASKGGILQIAFNNADTRNNFIDLKAAHDITANGSGIIGYNINLKAGGDVKGLVIGRESVAINAQQNVNVTAFSGGNVDISAAGNISGTVISGGSVNASGDSITASLISDSISTSGNANGATEGIPQSNVAQNNPQTADNADVTTSKSDGQDDAELKKKSITLARRVGRVTVVLPGKE
jgi:filamentous hemagglutinin family protein